MQETFYKKKNDIVLICLNKAKRVHAPGTLKIKIDNKNRLNQNESVPFCGRNFSLSAIIN